MYIYIYTCVMHACRYVYMYYMYMHRYQCACGNVSLSLIKYEVCFYCFQYHKEWLRFHLLYLPKEYEMLFYLYC